MKIRKLLIAPVLMISLMLAACGGSVQPAVTESTSENQSETPSEAEAETPDGPTGPELSEMAMDNFLKKTDEGNYTIKSETFMEANVFSRDLVTFEYVDEAYNDFAVMSVNDEAFQAFLKDDGLTDVQFVGEGQAIDAAGSRLLNHWTDKEVSDGNIYNLFYNSTDEPLTFVSYDENVKKTLISFVGYGENSLRLMQEVYMVMDSADPAEVHLKAAVDDDMVARISYDDIDVVVTFGDAKDNAEAEKWMSAPVYPAAREGWTDADKFVFNSVFLPGYGDDAVPFPEFASYAFMIDSENFVMTDEADMRDPHATEQDMADYIDVLLKNGFSEVTETDEDGITKTAYRKMLREEYKCYVSIELEYRDGVNMVAKKYYDFPVYEGIDAVNEVIVNRGYLPLPADDNILITKASDKASALTESWLYFYDYDLNLYVDVEYSDYDGVVSYLEQYAQSLVNNGFRPVMADEKEIDHYDSADGFYNFRYHFDEDNSLTLLFKSERYISADETEAMITAAGFPAIDLSDPITTRDMTKYQKVQFGRDVNTYLTVSMTFDTTQDAEQFLGDYEAALNEAGFDRENPGVVGTNKQVAIYNEEAKMLVGIDLLEQSDYTLVNLEFRAE